jgi:DeoR/GlpR family transcriptional regulator of sugar metabolism
MQIQRDLSNIERQESIRQYVEQKQRVSVQELSQLFAISLATARRDLEALSDQGLVQRIHGGAIAVRKAPPEPPLLHRAQEMAEEKRRIGQAVANLVLDGETIFLGSGTTVSEVALALKERQNLTVITNSLLVLNALFNSPGITIISLGGVLRTSELSFIGHLTEQALSEVRADKVIIGIRAIDIEAGLTNDYLPETMTDRAILRIGRQVIIAADHSKCGCTSTAFVASISAIDVLVTDQAVSRDFVEGLQREGIQVILA